MLVSFFWELEGTYSCCIWCMLLFWEDIKLCWMPPTHLQSTFFLGGDYTPRLVLSMARITLSSFLYYRLFIDYLGWHPLRTALGKGQIMQANWNYITAKDPKTLPVFSCTWGVWGGRGGRPKTRKVLSHSEEECFTRAQERRPLDGGEQARNITMHQLVCSKRPWALHLPSKTAVPCCVPCLVWGRQLPPGDQPGRALRSALKIKKSHIGFELELESSPNLRTGILLTLLYLLMCFSHPTLYHLGLTTTLNFVCINSLDFPYINLSQMYVFLKNE